MVMIPNTKCARCHWKYPASYLSPFRSSKGDTDDVCGICALELSSEALGVKREKFTGRFAEELRLNAISWRERHPDLAPALKLDAISCSEHSQYEPTCPACQQKASELKP